MYLDALLLFTAIVSAYFILDSLALDIMRLIANTRSMTERHRMCIFHIKLLLLIPFTVGMIMLFDIKVKVLGAAWHERMYLLALSFFLVILAKMLIRFRRIIFTQQCPLD